MLKTQGLNIVNPGMQQWEFRGAVLRIQGCSVGNLGVQRWGFECAVSGIAVAAIRGAAVVLWVLAAPKVGGLRLFLSPASGADIPVSPKTPFPFLQRSAEPSSSIIQEFSGMLGCAFPHCLNLGCILGGCSQRKDTVGKSRIPSPRV